MANGNDVDGHTGFSDEIILERCPSGMSRGELVPALRSSDLLPSFFDEAAEEAFQSHSLSRVTRQAELTCRAAAALAILLALTSDVRPAAIASAGAAAEIGREQAMEIAQALGAFRRANAFADFALFSSLSVAFARDQGLARSCYSPALIAGLAHIVSVLSMSPDKVAWLLGAGQGLAEPLSSGAAGLWSAGSIGTLTTGLLVASLLVTGLSLRACLVMFHVVVPLHVLFSMWTGVSDIWAAVTSCSLSPQTAAFVFQGASLYFFAAAAFMLRRDLEKEARLQFSGSPALLALLQKKKAAQKIYMSEQPLAFTKSISDPPRKIQRKLSEKTDPTHAALAAAANAATSAAASAAAAAAAVAAAAAPVALTPGRQPAVNQKSDLPLLVLDGSDSESDLGSEDGACAFPGGLEAKALNGAVRAGDGGSGGAHAVSPRVIGNAPTTSTVGGSLTDVSSRGSGVLASLAGLFNSKSKEDSTKRILTVPHPPQYPEGRRGVSKSRTSSNRPASSSMSLLPPLIPELSCSEGPGSHHSDTISSRALGASGLASASMSALPDFSCESPVAQKEDSASSSSAVPNQALVDALRGKHADFERIRMMAAMVRMPSYTLRNFFDDCLASFPELTLFFQEEAQYSGKTASSGVTNEAEYQRTIGALFSVYWLLRLNLDGKASFCFGVDADWLPCGPRRSSHVSTSMAFRRVRTAELPSTNFMLSTTEMTRAWAVQTEAPAVMMERGCVDDGASDSSLGSKSTVNVDSAVSFAMMTEAQKRTSFFETMQWSMFSDLITQAGCQAPAPGFLERTMALLCLTAIHDIMKVEALLPVVQEEHAPYLGYEAGVIIRDHDVALSYILEHFPHLLPSFRDLPLEAQKSVLFTQGKMNFNHGWFVQAEAPPGAMLCTLKKVLMAGATAADLGLYFLHWFTDLAGAEATPLGGAEKFVLKFPHAVLASFLWSIPFLGKLEVLNETAVVEQYLKARWRVICADTPPPQDTAAIACMRIAIMAQSDETVVESFRALPAKDRSCLASELSYTGCEQQRYVSSPGSCVGPAFLIYYGPALLQKNVDSPRGFRAALRTLAEVMRVARMVWPLTPGKEAEVVTISVAELKMQPVETIVAMPSGSPRGRWTLVKQNERDGAIEFQEEDDPADAAAPGDTKSQPLRRELLRLEHCFSDSLMEQLSEESIQDEHDTMGLPSGGEWEVQRAGSRRASQLPFAADEDSGGVDSTIESGLAAKLRQENWLLRDQIATLNDEVRALRMRLNALDPGEMSIGAATSLPFVASNSVD